MKKLWLVAVVVLGAVLNPRELRAVGQTNQCGWCGTKCTNISMGMACMDISPPEGKSCVYRNGGCVMVEGVEVATPTVEPKVMAKEGESCGGLTGRVCEVGLKCDGGLRIVGTDQTGKCVREEIRLTPTCVPKPACIGGVVDASGNRVYCDPAPGVVYCSSVVPTRTAAKEGETCGGLAAILCEPGLRCDTGSRVGIPEQIGKCVKDSTVRGCIPKPACLAENPPCMMAEPEGGYCVTGDANRDGKVDLADFAMWKRAYVGGGYDSQVDFNGDEKVDLVDFSTWKTNYLIN